jgi:hypothetical protein
MSSLPVLRLIISHWKGYARPYGGVQKARLWAQLLIPVAAGVAVWFTGPTIDSTGIGVLLGSTSILTGLLFQLLLSVLALIQRLHDQVLDHRTGNRESTTVFLRYLAQLDADVAYTIVVGVGIAAALAASLFVGEPSDILRRCATGVVAAAMTHFALCLLQVLSRYRTASWRVVKDVGLDLDLYDDGAPRRRS